MNFPLVMGILNATPDSFYDGGQYDDANSTLKHIQKMLEEGAGIIDIGGESTGPGSVDVSEKEEMERIIPIIKKMRKMPANRSRSEGWKSEKYKYVRISIDTTKASVADAAIKAGADIVNDVSAGRNDEKMFPLVAETGCQIILMYSKDDLPRTTIKEEHYDDVIATIKTFLQERIQIVQSHGIKHTQIIIDPGLGHFVSSDSKYSWEILERLNELSSLTCPILVSPSRKSFTADHPNDPPSARLPGTLQAAKIALKNGASIIRTHDVAATQSLILPY